MLLGLKFLLPVITAVGVCTTRLALAAGKLMPVKLLAGMVFAHVPGAALVTTTPIWQTPAPLAFAFGAAGTVRLLTVMVLPKKPTVGAKPPQPEKPEKLTGVICAGIGSVRVAEVIVLRLKLLTVIVNKEVLPATIVAGEKLLATVAPRSTRNATLNAAVFVTPCVVLTPPALI